MREKNEIDLKILENADDDMINAMSSKYSPLNEGEVNRMFAKSKSKYKIRKDDSIFSEADEVSGVDLYIMQNKFFTQRLFRIAGTISVCISIIIIGFIWLKSMKIPLENNNTSPASINETTLSTVTSENETNEQIKVRNKTGTTNNAIADADVEKTEDEKRVTYDNDETTTEIYNGDHSTDDLRLMIILAQV